MNRLDVRKTYKLYIGGNFVRSESGRYLPAQSARGAQLDNFCHASRKDFRDAVVAARSAFEGWAKKSAYLRGQILYRAAEMLQNRAGELVKEIARSTDVSPADAQNEVALSIDRLVYYAGWTDKYSQIFGSVNPVASSHFNFTTPEPTGVVIILAPDQPALLPLVSLLAPVILSGNSAVVLASERHPLPAATFSEILATSERSCRQRVAFRSQYNCGVATAVCVPASGSTFNLGSTPVTCTVTLGVLPYKSYAFPIATICTNTGSVAGRPGCVAV